MLPMKSPQVIEGAGNLNTVISSVRRRLIGNGDIAPNSVDRSTLRELLWIHRLYERVQKVPGHIVELGTGPGSNAITFGNLIHLYGEDDIRKYYGFDTFEGYPVEDMESSPYLTEGRWDKVDIERVRDRLHAHGVSDVTSLMKGDLVESIPEWIENNDHRKSPGTVYLALLYIDCNAYRAAREGLEILRDYLSPGAIVAVDQLKQGGETEALREFCSDEGLEFQRAEPPIAHAPFTQIPDGW